MTKRLWRRVKEDFVVDGAFCVDEARSLLSSQHYHLILLDVELPDGSGLGFIQEIRQFLQTPIIFISVHDEDDFISRGLDDGICYFVWHGDGICRLVLSNDEPSIIKTENVEKLKSYIENARHFSFAF